MLRPRRSCLLISALFSSVFTPAGNILAATTPDINVAQVKFDSNFLSGSDKIDLSRFEKGNVALPGTYRVGINFNQAWKGLQEITFKAVDGKAGAAPCYDRALLNKWGVDLDKVARGDGKRSQGEVDAHQIPAGELCGDLNQWIADATTFFDNNEQTLTLTVPQIYMNASARGYVDPALLDSGVSAGILGYNFATSTATQGGQGTQSYLGLNAGINLGDWHLRHQGSQGWSSLNGRNTYQNTATFVQRDVSALQSQLVLGDSFTDGSVMESIRLRGFSLGTDDRQTPQSQQGYAPIVRGIANSNARVTISQKGYTIYETTVAAGPFLIDDLAPVSTGGDLLVTVTEADGKQTAFLVPFAQLPQLLRAGTSRFSVAAGQLKQYGNNDSSPWVMQGTLQRGFNNFMTGYSGLIISDGYLQGKVGTAFSTPIGAMAVDASVSSTQFQDHPTWQGQSYGVTYSKNISQTGTNVALGAYRFSSNGFLGLNDAVNARDLNKQGLDPDTTNRQRSRLDINIQQSVGDKDSLFLSGSSTAYAGNVGHQTSFSAGYNSSWRNINWSLTAQRVLAQATQLSPEQQQQQQLSNIFYGPGVNGGRNDNRIMLTLSMPLGKEINAPRLNTNLTHNTGSSNSNDLQVGVTGNMGDDRQFDYAVSGSHSTGDNRDNSGNASINYSTRAATLGASISQAERYGQIAFNANGSVIAHRGGITLAQTVGETFGIVEAKGAAGAGVSNSTGVTVNDRGYAVIPYLQPYQFNEITIDPKNTSDDLQFKDTVKSLAPRAGAVVLYKFETDNSRSVIIKALRSDGQPLPFAAEVLDQSDHSVGVVGQASKAFVRGIPDTGKLTVKWGKESNQQCHISYTLPVREKGQHSSDLIDGQCVVLTGAANAPSNAPSEADK